MRQTVNTNVYETATRKTDRAFDITEKKLAELAAADKDSFRKRTYKASHIDKTVEEDAFEYDYDMTILMTCDLIKSLADAAFDAETSDAEKNLAKAFAIARIADNRIRFLNRAMHEFIGFMDREIPNSSYADYKENSKRKEYIDVIGNTACKAIDEFTGELSECENKETRKICQMLCERLLFALRYIETREMMLVAKTKADKGVQDVFMAMAAAYLHMDPMGPESDDADELSEYMLTVLNGAAAGTAVA
jgi:hypothetical protein